MKSPTRAAALIATALLLCGRLVGSQSAALTITLTGQSMIRSDLRMTRPSAMPRIRSLLSGDVVFTNLEGAIADPGQSVSGGGRGFLIPPQALDALTTMGFNLLALSNNHAFDLSITGIENTLREVTRRNIAHAGTGRTLAEAAAPAYLTTPKGKLALVSSASGLIAAGGNATADRPGVNELRLYAGGQPNEASVDLPGASANVPDKQDAERILASIREARRQADVVIVYQHNHVFGNQSFSNLFTEGLPDRLGPNAWLKQWTHAEVDAGADIVVMHGAPLLHGIEMYHGKPIFYDLGNFIYNVPPAIYYISEPMAWESVVAKVEVQGRTLKSISLHPVELNYVGSGDADLQSQYTSNEFLHTRGLPSPATGPKAKYILERLTSLSAAFRTKIDIKGDVAEVRISR